MDTRLLLSAALPLLIAVNLLSFALMGIDKHCARRGRRRVPERTLLLAAACFGGLGGVLGMRVFRHKTRHKRFRWSFPALLILQAALLAAGALFLR